MPTNPFTPTFGATPPEFVDRTETLEDFDLSLDEGPGSPARALLLRGTRGIGKTVLLNALEARAKERGWVVISESQPEGLVARLIEHRIPEALAETDFKEPSSRVTVTGVNVSVAGAGLGIQRQSIARADVSPDLRAEVFSLLDKVEAHDAGLLISLDEVRVTAECLPDLRNLCDMAQHAVRQGRQLALVVAGLPSNVNALMEVPGLTFLQRATLVDLLPIRAAASIRAALQRPIEREGRRIDDASLDLAVGATRGYPFLIQLIGYHSFRQHPTEAVVSRADVKAGILAAHRRLGSQIHEPALRDLSHVARTFLAAMAQDDGPSLMGDIAKRLGVDSNYASQYRLKLLAEEIIRATGRGRVDFALPYLREYLRDHAGSSALNGPESDRD